jgi:hypothetical protein
VIATAKMTAAVAKLARLAVKLRTNRDLDP